MERAKRSGPGNAQSAPGPTPRSGGNDLQDQDRDRTDRGRPAPDDEPKRSDPDAGLGRPVQLEIPAAE
jgi:hypothetical protein